MGLSGYLTWPVFLYHLNTKMFVGLKNLKVPYIPSSQMSLIWGDWPSFEADFTRLRIVMRVSLYPICIAEDCNRLSMEPIHSSLERL